MQLPTSRDNAFNRAKELAKYNGKMDIYESLVVQYTNPNGEWGHNNIRDLITLFHESGQTKEQIYNILYGMGVEKERAYSAIEEYIPKTNTSENMNIKEQLDFTDSIRNLVDKMEEFKTDDSANYNADAVIRTCESYLSTNLEDATSSMRANIGKRLISDLNQYDFIPSVKECINSIETSIYENAMGIEVDSVYTELSNSSQSKMYASVLDRLKVLREMDESSIRSNINDRVGEFSTWVPKINSLLEKAEVIIGKKDKVKSLSERFNIKGRIKKIVESLDNIHTENSKVIIRDIKAICESYLKDVYNNNNSVSEAVIAGNLINALSNYSWLDSIKENINDISNFLKENYMSFEVDIALRNLVRNNNNSFYNNAIDKLGSIKSLTESEIREEIKYGMDSLTWVPNIKYLVETVNALEGNISENENVSISRKYSPVLEHEGTTYFYLSGNVYGLNENKLTVIDQKSMGPLYLTLIAVTENFKFKPNSMVYYKGNNSIEFQLTENGTVFKFNNSKVDVNESNDIRHFLLNNGTLRINESSELDMIVKAYENINSFTELDFVDSISSRNKRGVNVNVIRLEESIYINKINENLRINEMIKAESATNAIELVQEYINYDISPSLYDLLEGEQKIKARIDAKRNQLFDRIQFLKESRARINSVDNMTDELKAADNLLIESIDKYQEELNNL